MPEFEYGSPEWIEEMKKRGLTEAPIPFIEPEGESLADMQKRMDQEEEAYWEKLGVKQGTAVQPWQRELWTFIGRKRKRIANELIEATFQINMGAKEVWLDYGQHKNDAQADRLALYRYWSRLTGWVFMDNSPLNWMAVRGLNATKIRLSLDGPNLNFRLWLGHRSGLPPAEVDERSWARLNNLMNKHYEAIQPYGNMLTDAKLGKVDKEPE